MSTLLVVLAALSSILGFAALSLSQARNWRSVTHRPGVASIKRRLRLFGLLMFLVALVICIFRDGVSFALLTWPLWLTCGAMSVAMILAFRPKWLMPMAKLFEQASAEAEKA